jgi:hypothetical protein
MFKFGCIAESNSGEEGVLLIAFKIVKTNLLRCKKYEKMLDVDFFVSFSGNSCGPGGLPVEANRFRGRGFPL